MPTLPDFSPVRMHPSSPQSLACRLLLACIFTGFALGSAEGGAPKATDRVLFSNSVGPLPEAVAPSIRPMQKEHLEEKMEVEVPLKMRNFPQLLDKIAKGRQLSRAELEKDHLPLPADYANVQLWLKNEGFAITQTDPSRLSIFAEASLSRIQQSLQTEMVKLTYKGKSYNAARTHPSLPSAIAGGVLGVNGLQPFLMANRLTPDLNPATANQPPYLVGEVLGAYNASNLGVTGKGQTIAILIDSIPRNTDLTAFWSANGISQSVSNVQAVNVNGSVPIDSEGEATLDVEWASSVAPEAVVRVYVTASLSFTAIDKALQKIINDLPSQPNLRQLSISLGLGETYLAGSSEMQTESQYFATLAASGVSVFVSSGDAGSNPDNTGHNSPTNPGPLQVSYEASDPSVTGVGGTNLFLSANGTVISETGWYGSGGGNSQFFNRPSWQTGPGIPSGSKRLVPDVSLVASDTTYAYFYFKGKSGGIAGTSWSAPVWAGFSALINEARNKVGLASLGLLNPKIYPLLGTSNFRDITSGSNGAYTAGVGYDRVTGIGVPNVAVLMTTLTGTGNALPAITHFSPASGAPGTSVTISGQNLNRATSVAFNGASAIFTADSATQITAAVPAAATTGTISVVAPTGTGVSPTSFTVLPAVPPNDQFADAQILSGSTGAVNGSNVGGGHQAGEPVHAENAGGASVWYAWNAPQDGIYTFDTAGSSFDTLLAVYTGSVLGSLSQVAANDDAGTGVASAVSFTATAGTLYQIAVDGHDAQVGTLTLTWIENTSNPSINNFVPSYGAPGTIVVIYGASFTGATAVHFGETSATSFTVNSPTQLTVTVPSGATTGVISVLTPSGTAGSAGIFTVNTPPRNDAFDAADVASGPDGTLTGGNVGATSESGEPEHAGNEGGHSVWFSWTAPASNYVTFNTFGSSFDTVLAVYTGASVSTTTLIAQNDDAGTAINSAASFSAVEGITYKIAVDGAGGGIGSIVLNWASEIAAPVISSFTPDSGGAGGSVTLSGVGFLSVTEVTFNGVSANFFILSDSQIITTVPPATTTGVISVTNISGTGSSSAQFTVFAAPPNDNFSNALTFAGNGVVSGTNIGATRETGEPNHGGNGGSASIWWNWTAPTTADYRISTLGSTFDTLLAVYTGSSVDALTTIGNNDSDPNGGSTSLLTLHAEAGTLYHIAVDGANGTTGIAALSISPILINTLFETGFEASESYSATAQLSGQNEWTNAGNGSNGILNEYFEGMGQQAYIGSRIPRGGSASTFVWRPINYAPVAGDKITFDVTMQIVDSTNYTYDDFAWAVYNKEGKTLFRLHFDNQTLELGYELDDGQGFQSTGYYFDNFTVYEVTITMDFAANRWSAALNGFEMVTDQKITTINSPLNLGNIDAAWLVTGFRPGNNSMVFDNYKIVNASADPARILLEPQSLVAMAGSAALFTVVPGGGAPFTFQWQKNNVNIPGATTANFSLVNVQQVDAGQYRVIVTNDGGSATSNVAVMSVTLPQLANLTPKPLTGWSDAVIVTTVPGSITSPLFISNTEDLYVNWAIANNGIFSTPSSFQSSLYVDGALKNIWKQSVALLPGDVASVLSYPIGPLSSGTHTVQIVTDSGNQTAEFNEADNSFSKTVVVTNPVPTFMITTSADPTDGGSISGAGVYRTGMSATLVATAGPDESFVKWTDEAGIVSKSASYTFTVTKNRTLTAHFTLTADIGKPEITITTPTSNSSYASIAKTIYIAGNASSDADIKQITWINDRGGSGKAKGSSIWSIAAVPLRPGQNVITVTIIDKIGRQASKALTVQAAASTDFSGSYSASLLTTEATPAFAGACTFAVNASGSFTATISIAGTTSRVTGRFGQDGDVLIRLAKANLTYRFVLASGPHPTINGTVSAIARAYTFRAQRAGFHATKHPFLEKGSYTFVLQPGSAISTAPAGTGIGTLKVDAAGKVRLAGRLADGTPFSQGSTLAESALAPLNLTTSWPFYCSPYKKSGFAAGQAAFQTDSPSLVGKVLWKKPTNAKGGHYGTQIATTVTLNGDKFIPGSSSTFILKAGARALTLAAGDLSTEIDKTATLTAPKLFGITPLGDDKVLLSVDPKSGLLKGSFIHPKSKTKVDVQAVALQEQDFVSGYFLGPTESGSLTITAAPDPEAE